MARTGRPKKPTEIKRRAGTLQACREKGRNEPDVEAGIPDRPEWVAEPDHVKAWDELVRSIPPGVLSASDGIALAMLSEALASYKRAQGHLDVSIGRWMSETSGGNEGESPWVKLRDRNWKRFVDMSQRFGLDPGARASMHVQKPTKPAEKSIAAQLLDGGSPVATIGVMAPGRGPSK